MQHEAALYTLVGLCTLRRLIVGAVILCVAVAVSQTRASDTDHPPARSGCVSRYRADWTREGAPRWMAENPMADPLRPSRAKWLRGKLAAGTPPPRDVEPLSLDFPPILAAVSPRTGSLVPAWEGPPPVSAVVQPAECGAPPRARFDSVSGRLWNVRDEFCSHWDRLLWTDHVNYYTWETVIDFSIVLAGAATLANTAWDHNIYTWYQEDVRSDSTNEIARFGYAGGEGKELLPSYAAMALIGSLAPDVPCVHALSDFGYRTLRAFAVGSPLLIAMQRIPGGSRPMERDHHSKWCLLNDDNSVSGHAFMGSLPFINLAMCVEEPPLKLFFYGCSGLTAFSRLNDSAHYLSQCILGWYCGYLACRAVNRTDNLFESKHCRITPIASPRMTGLSLVFSR